MAFYATSKLRTFLTCVYPLSLMNYSRSMFQIKNVSLAIQHGEKGSKITPPASAFVESTELNDQLGKPFHLLYIGSKVKENEMHQKSKF